MRSPRDEYGAEDEMALIPKRLPLRPNTACGSEQSPFFCARRSGYQKCITAS